MPSDPAARTIPLFDPQSEFAKRALGMLIAEMGGVKKEMPLAAVDIQAKVADRISDVTVSQKFRNTFPDHLEAVYIFPLAHSAVVTSFEMRVGSRIVKGEVKERKQARQDYQAAIQQGKRSALMEQERDDVFTMQVGNIAPGEEVSVRLTYSERLPFFEDGSCEIRLPLVVAPRYIAGNALNRDSVGMGTENDTDQVPDASRITPPRLVDGAKDNVQLSISVELLQSSDGVFNVKDLSSSQHVVGTSLEDGSIKVELSKEDELMNRDFILKWVAAEKNLKPNLVTYSDEKGNTYCMLTVMAPKQEKFLGVPRDVIFIVDRSGSMGGPKMASAAKSCSILLDTLGPQDRFAICAFDDMNEWMQPHAEWTSSVSGKFVGADESGIESGKAYLRTVTARGGTELEPALAEALGEFKYGKRADASGIIVILTDGQVGNESYVYKRLQEDLGDARVFTVGIDTAVNGGILTRMATLGGGTSALVTPGAKLEKALGQIGREIGVPVLTGLKLEAVTGNLEADTVTPSSLPDLFRGRATTVFFKMSQGLFSAKGKKKIRIKGTRADGSPYVEEVTEKRVGLPAVASLYAKSLIRDLEDALREETRDQHKISRQMIDVSLAHSVLCRLTAFVAVDTEVTNQDGKKRTVVQAVHQPADWEAIDSLNTSTKPLAARSRGQLQSFASGVQTYGSASFGSPPPGAAPATPQSLPAPNQASSGGWGSSGGSWGASNGGVSTGSSLPFLGGPKAPGGPGSSNDGSWNTPIQEKFGMAGAGGQPPTPSELVAALNNLVLVIGDLVRQFASGAPFDWNQLESARALCLKHLQASRFASCAPRLQQFLRTEAVECVAALKAGGLTADVVDRVKRALVELDNEIDSIKDNREPVASIANFWENTI
ncbi:MAG: VIT and VWA domain-containing protein [Candidatus Obscuribacterales bacterium]|nr:VIT and VWA domain-containing protein [Candidatus Obscuribacterales bacterium]